MQFNITSSLGVCLSGKGFSLDELIYRLDDLFKNKAFPEIMAGILMTFDEWLKVLVMKKARLPFSCRACRRGAGAKVRLRRRSSRGFSVRPFGPDPSVRLFGEMGLTVL